MSKKQKLFVLDTSVLLHDHHAIMHFERHDVAIPITVLEELDKFKIGNDTKNFSAREVIRFIDRISLTGGLQTWISLGKSMGSFKVLLNQSPTGIDAEEMYGSGKNDHKIINATLAIKEEDAKREVILVTKDINLRIKAKALGIHAEDYETGKVDDTDLRTSSTTTIEDVDSDVIKQLFLKGSIEESGVLGNLKVANGYYILKNGKSSSLTYFDPLTDTLHRVEKEYTSGIKPKNAEQAFAVNALMNNNIKLVALQGVAGTGKTLLALAAALEQQKQFQQIILARPLVPLSNKEIGFLPGDAKDKIGPYMEPLWDNLKFIKSQFGENEKKHKAIVEMEESGRILITPLAFIRGRSLSNILFIVDEAQNLTPHEVKTIITRAGEGTKIVFTGDVHQIDTPYLTEGSSGLSYAVEHFRSGDSSLPYGWEHYGHIILAQAVRSRLASQAEKVLK